MCVLVDVRLISLGERSGNAMVWSQEKQVYL